MKKRATYQEVYEHISYHRWKTFLDIKSELELEGKSANHMRGIVYIQFSRWEREGYIASRKRESKNLGFEGLPKNREYLKILNSTPIEFREPESSLLQNLFPTPASA